ncbi:siderophore-iron reductase FhuF [Pseudomonas abieticivorans]|uniref:siderophore-iron reductase FhuF n=1 Tax=Pseudomonas abieticivorans TaxID=2931382 RepID=UPI0020BF5C99|nr:siderophore-iron reductase FhuF [Pseudomonas sp. PIA16]
MSPWPDWQAGPYASFMGGLLPLVDDQPFEPLPQLLQPTRLDVMLIDIYGPDLMPSQKPVLVSQWAKYYFMHWLPAMLVSQLAYGWYLPLALDEIGMVLDERGLPKAIVLLHAGEPGAADESLEPWVQANLRPFIEQLSAYGEVPPAVLWGNAGDYLELNVRRLQALGLNVAPAQALLESRRSADGRINPLYAPVRYKADGARQRRACCLAYKVEWVGHCEHCPLA